MPTTRALSRRRLLDHLFLLAPLLVMTVIIAGFRDRPAATAQGTIVNQVLAYTNSPEAAQLVQTVIENNRSVQIPYPGLGHQSWHSLLRRVRVSTNCATR